MTMLTRISSLNKKKPLASCSIGLTVVLASIYDIIAINKWILENKPSNYNTFFSREHMVSRIQVSRTCFLTHHPQPHHRVKSQVSRKANCQTSATPIINARDPHHSFNLLTMGLLIINAESLMNLDLLGIRLLNQSALQHHV